MDSKIKELTEKIYQEGVQKGNEEAARIVEAAQAEARRIVAEAKKQAQQLEERSKRETTEFRQQTERELQLYAGQLIESTKASVSDLLTTKLVDQDVKAATEDLPFLQQMILEFARNFNLEKGLVISTKEAEALKAYFASRSAELLNKGLEVREIGGEPTSFVVSPKDGGYKIEFSPEHFAELFRSFLRPQMAQILFGNK